MRFRKFDSFKWRMATKAEIESFNRVPISVVSVSNQSGVEVQIDLRRIHLEDEERVILDRIASTVLQRNKG
jgi:hypothetical protein